MPNLPAQEIMINDKTSTSHPGARPTIMPQAPIKLNAAFAKRTIQLTSVKNTRMQVCKKNGIWSRARIFASTTSRKAIATAKKTANQTGCAQSAKNPTIQPSTMILRVRISSKAHLPAIIVLRLCILTQKMTIMKLFYCPQLKNLWETAPAESSHSVRYWTPGPNPHSSLKKQ